MLERLSKLKRNKTTLRTEILSGATTFKTMSYIILVQPIVLSIAGMDIGSVMAATCVSAAVGTILMGLLADYPIPPAPPWDTTSFLAISVVRLRPAGVPRVPRTPSPTAVRVSFGGLEAR